MFGLNKKDKANKPPHWAIVSNEGRQEVKCADCKEVLTGDPEEEKNPRIPASWIFSLGGRPLCKGCAGKAMDLNGTYYNLLRDALYKLNIIRGLYVAQEHQRVKQEIYLRDRAQEDERSRAAADHERLEQERAEAKERALAKVIDKELSQGAAQPSRT